MHEDRELKIIDYLSSLVFSCTTEEEVEKVFSQYGLGYDFRTRVLRTAMHIENYIDRKDWTDKETYEYELAVFLEGTWRSLVFYNLCHKGVEHENQNC